MTQFVWRAVVAALGIGVAAVLSLRGHEVGAWLTAGLVVAFVFREYLRSTGRVVARTAMGLSRADFVAAVSFAVFLYSATQERWPQVGILSWLVALGVFLRVELNALAYTVIADEKESRGAALGKLAAVLIALVAVATGQQITGVAALLAFVLVTYRDKWFIEQKQVREQRSRESRSRARERSRGEARVVLDGLEEQEVSRRLTCNDVAAEIMLAGLSIEDVGLLLSVVENGRMEVSEEVKAGVDGLLRRGLVLRQVVGSDVGVVGTEAGRRLAGFLTRAKLKGSDAGLGGGGPDRVGSEDGSGA